MWRGTVDGLRDVGLGRATRVSVWPRHVDLHNALSWERERLAWSPHFPWLWLGPRCLPPIQGDAGSDLGQLVGHLLLRPAVGSSRGADGQVPSAHPRNVRTVWGG